jgi:hypothetical protein
MTSVKCNFCGDKVFTPIVLDLKSDITNEFDVYEKSQFVREMSV